MFPGIDLANHNQNASITRLLLVAVVSVFTFEMDHFRIVTLIGIAMRI
jgi:hypothetical protein